MGRPALKKSGPMSNAERLRRRRQKVAREKKLAPHEGRTPISAETSNISACP